MIVFVTRTIFVFVGKLLSTYATIVCRYICAFCNDCICFQNNLCICACWQVVGCHSDRSDGTLAYSTRLPSLLVAHLQKPIARRTSTNICNGTRDICNGHAKKFTTNKHKLWLYKAAAGVIMYIGIVFKYYEMIVTIICHHEIVTELIVAWSGRPLSRGSVFLRASNYSPVLSLSFVIFLHSLFFRLLSFSPIHVFCLCVL